MIYYYFLDSMTYAGPTTTYDFGVYSVDEASELWMHEGMKVEGNFSSTDDVKSNYPDAISYEDYLEKYEKPYISSLKIYCLVGKTYEDLNGSYRAPTLYLVYNKDNKLVGTGTEGREYQDDYEKSYIEDFIENNPDCNVVCIHEERQPAAYSRGINTYNKHKEA